MKTSALPWIPVIVSLVAACNMPSTELGSTRTQWTWVSDASDVVRAMATTPADEIVVLLGHPASDHSTLRKHEPDGAIAWTLPVTQAIDVAVDDLGTIVVLGLESNGTGTLLAHASDGAPLWTTPLPEGVQATGLGILGDRTIVVAANVEDQAEVRAYLPSGAPSWTQPLADDATDPVVTGLATSRAGHIIVGGPLASGETWVARLSAAGDVTWIQTALGDRLHALAIDDEGTSFATGSDNHRLWLRRLTPAGALEWEQVDPFDHPASARDAAFGDDGTLYWVGTDYGHALIVALDPDGAERWRELVTGPPPVDGARIDEDDAAAVALSPTGDVVVGGSLDYRSRGTSDTWFRGWLGRYATDE